MTASAPLRKQPVPQRSAALPHCSHSRMHFGLDRAYCPDCKRDFRPKTPEYKAFLNEASTAMVAQQIAKQECLNANIIPDSSEAAPYIGQAKQCLNANRQGSDATMTEVASEQIPSSIEPNCSGADSIRVAPEHNHWVEIYSPSTRPNCKYFRYMWMEGRKLKHKHIGGNIKSDRATKLKLEVEQTIKAGKTPGQIVEMMKSWKVSDE